MRYLTELVLTAKNPADLQSLVQNFSLAQVLPVPAELAEVEEVDVFFYELLIAGRPAQAKRLHDEMGLNEYLTWPQPTAQQLETLKRNWPDAKERAKRVLRAMGYGAQSAAMWKQQSWGGPNSLNALNWAINGQHARVVFASQNNYGKGLHEWSVRFSKTATLSALVYGTTTRTLWHYEQLPHTTAWLRVQTVPADTTLEIFLLDLESLTEWTLTEDHLTCGAQLLT